MRQPDEDALNVMKQAGQEFAQKQRYRHYSNEWKLSKEQQWELIAHWNAVENRIGELVKQMRQELKEQQ